MNRYRSYGQQDDQPQVAGDQAFLGVNEYDTPQNLTPGEVQKAVNMDFKTQVASTRGGFVCLPELGAEPFGTTWTQTTVSATTNWTDVAYGNGVWVAVGQAVSGYGTVMTSTDGATWTVQTISNAPAFQAVEFGNGVFVAVGVFFGTALTGIRTSTDGVTWTTPASNSDSDHNMSVAYGNGKWAVLAYEIVSHDWYTYTSTDNGTTWLKSFVRNHNGGIDGYIAYGNGAFVATLPFLSSVGYSTNATSWTFYAIPDPDPIGLQANDLAFGAGKFALVNQNGSIWTSANGFTWTRTRNKDVSGSTAIWYAMAASDNGFVVAGANSWGTLASLTGDEWIRSSTAISGTYYGGGYNNGLYIFVGASGAVAYSSSPIISVYGSSIYSDPSQIGVTWIMLLGAGSVGFYAQGHTSRTVSLGGATIAFNTQATILQANNYVYIFRGSDAKPLYWNGDWNSTFAEVPDTTLPSSFNSIPNSNQATYYQNRLWVKDGKDEIAASDVLAFTDYDPLANEFNLNTGNSDYVVATFPFGQNSLIGFKNKSVLLLQNVEGSLSDVTVTEVTRQVGLIGINAVCSIGPDLAYASNRNINLLTLTSTNNSLQHKTLPLSTKIRKIMDRVNWEYGYKISMGYWNNRLYVALPLDNSQFCNTVVVYNFITDNWYGEWSFSSTMNMCIQGWQVVDYLGLQRLHAITEDGRIFVTDEGQNDISGTTVAEISTELTTRAYMTQNLNHFQRRMFMDVGTNRPTLSVSVFTDGASEESVLMTDQTYSRSESWLFNDSSYDLTNANDDYNRAYRKDYSTGPNSVQCGTGFQPEMLQEQRLPLISRRQGRLSWINVQNTQGLLTIRTLGYETRPGQRANLTQV